MSRSNAPIPAAALAAALVLCHVAAADLVRVRVTGEVEYNAFASGALAGVPTGSPVTLQFDVDSAVFVESVALPGRTRGYPIVGDSLTFTAGPITVTRNLSLPANFCLRNNDPRADGFFLSQGTDLDTPIPLVLGLAQNYGAAFSRTFNIDPPFPTPDDSLTSLDILTGGALGSWGFDDISSYNFTVELNENVVPLGVAYQTLTISRVGCTGALCPADFNCSGAAPTAQDVYDFFSDWDSQLSGGPVLIGSADFNGSGGVSVQDLFDFLEAWLEGCGS